MEGLSAEAFVQGLRARTSAGSVPSVVVDTLCPPVASAGASRESAARESGQAWSTSAARADSGAFPWDVARPTPRMAIAGRSYADAWPTLGSMIRGTSKGSAIVLRTFDALCARTSTPPLQWYQFGSRSAIGIRVPSQDDQHNRDADPSQGVGAPHLDPRRVTSAVPRAPEPGPGQGMRPRRAQAFRAACSLGGRLAMRWRATSGPRPQECANGRERDCRRQPHREEAQGLKEGAAQETRSETESFRRRGASPAPSRAPTAAIPRPPRPRDRRGRGLA